MLAMGQDAAMTQIYGKCIKSKMQGVPFAGENHEKVLPVPPPEVFHSLCEIQQDMKAVITIIACNFEIL
jgi:hypothetical protein